MITAKVVDAYAKEKLAIIEKTITETTLWDVVRQGARLLAIECARTSQPFGTGEDAKTTGEKAVSKDIAEVYAMPGRVWDDIADKRSANAFWRNFREGRFERAQQILNKSGDKLQGVYLQPFDGGSAHIENRSFETGGGGRGLVQLNKPAMIVIDGGDDGSAYDRYVIDVQGRVGYGKGAWADVARQISGSIRGLKSDEEGDISASWITSKGAGLGKISVGGTDIHPEVTVSSTVHYADQILNGSAQETAKKIARDKMIANLRIRAQYDMERLGYAA